MRHRVREVLEWRGWRLTLWYLIAVASVAITFLAGPYIQFPIAFVVPVVLAAWFDGLAHAATFAVALPVSRLAFVLGVWTVPWSESHSLANAIIRIVVLGLVAVLVSRLAKQHRALRHEVAMLERIFPICSYCRRIRGQDEAWYELEPYLRTHAELTFSHGYCPDCVRQRFPEYSGPGR